MTEEHPQDLGLTGLASPSPTPSPSRRQALAWLGALACGTQLSAPVWAQGTGANILRVAAIANPSSLDPATGGSGGDHAFLWTIFDTLVSWDYETLRTRAGMAEYRFQDPKTLVLDIKPGIVFHDGEAMDAQAVKFNLDRNRQDPVSNVKADLASIEGVEVTGPLQVALHLKTPDVSLPAVLSDRAGMMCSPRAIKSLGKKHDRQPVGAGPWKFVSWTDNEKVVVTRNDKYWRAGLPKVDGIDFSIITDNATALRSVIAGQNDLIFNITARYKPLIERAKDLRLVTAPTLYCVEIYFNWSRAPLSNPKVRQAINFALDRKAFIAAGMGGLGEVAGMLLPPSHWAWDKETAGLYPYDPAHARKLLAEAGLGSGVDMTIGAYNDQDNLRRNEIVQEQLGKVGIRCRFMVGTIPEISGQFFGNEKKFDALLAAWTGRPDPSMSYGYMYSPGAYYNAGRTQASPEITDLIAQSRQKFTEAERKAVFSKLQLLVMQGAFSAPLCFSYDVIALGKRVTGFKPDLLGKPKFTHVALS